MSPSDVTGAVRIAMWSGPRNLSTAMMRSFQNSDDCTVGDCSLTDLVNADEVFVTGTLGGVTPVVSVDGRRIGLGSRGPVGAAIAAAYAARTAVEGTLVV